MNILRKCLRIGGKLPGVKKSYNLIKKPLFNVATFVLNLQGYELDQGLGLISASNRDFMSDPNFVKGWNAACHQVADSKYYSFYNIYINQWAANRAACLDGDFVECGVHLGGTAMSNITLLDFNRFENKKYYLFDTFSGFDKDFTSEEEAQKYEGLYGDTFNYVSKSFSPYKNVIIVKGSVPNTLNDVKIDRVAYLHIDMNSELPEIAAIKHFWPKMVAGGFIILDDYGWPKHWRQRKAMDVFAGSVNTKILSLPTGQGLLIKY